MHFFQTSCPFLPLQDRPVARRIEVTVAAAIGLGRVYRDRHLAIAGNMSEPLRFGKYRIACAEFAPQLAGEA
jgi:hypothetical protein